MKAFTQLTVATALIILIGCNPDDDDYGTPTYTPPPNNGCTITCQNGGTVTSNCDCNCPNGFYGTNCQNQQTPDRFKVTSIKLTNFPSTNNAGNNWDNGNGTDVRPDIRIEFNLGTNEYLHTSYYANCNPANDYTYNESSKFPFYLNVGTTYDFRLYDYDFGTTSDDIMLNSFVNIGNYAAGLPTVLNWSAGGSSFKVYGSWQF